MMAPPHAGISDHSTPPEDSASLYPQTEDDYDKLLSWCKRAFEEAQRARQPFEDRWKRFSTLYRMYKARDPNDWRSRVFVPVIFTVVETILPRLVAQLPKFLVMPVGPEDVEPAAQMEQLLDWAASNSDLFYELVLATKGALKYGTGITKTYWKTETSVRRIKVPNMVPQMAQQVQPQLDPETGLPMFDLEGQPIHQTIDVEVGQVQQGYTTVTEPYVAYDGPKAEAVDIMNFFPAPEATDVDDARYVIHRVYRPMRYVKDLIDKGVFTPPQYGNFSFSELADVSDEPLRNRLGDLGMDMGSVDSSLRRPVELLEFWTDDGRVIVVANRKCVLRVAENPFDHGQKPFCRIVDYLQEHMFWGMGEAEAQEGLQDAQNAIVNQRIDNVRIALDRMFVVREDHLVDRGDLKRRPGGVIRVNSAAGNSLDQSVFPVDVPDVTASAYEEAQALQDMSERVSAVNAYTQGQDSPSLNDTATGISLLQEAGNTRFALKTTLAELMGLKRLARQWGSMLQQFTDEQKIVRILGPKGEVLFQTFDPESLQGALDFDIETASSTQTESIRRQQSLSLLQVLSNYLPPVPVMQPAIDPATGQPMTGPDGNPVMQPAMNPDGTPQMQQSPGVTKLIEDVLQAFNRKDIDAYLGGGEQQDLAATGAQGAQGGVESQGASVIPFPLLPGERTSFQ